MSRSSHDPHDAGGRGVETVVVHGSGVRVDRAHAEIPLAEVRSRFGGVDPLAVLAGVAAALGTLLVLSSLLSAAGVGGYGQVDQETLGIAAVVGGLLALGLSLLFGGYVAGRTARYAGVRNGLLTGLLFLLLSAALGALAASSDAASRLSLPGWLDRGDARTAALVTSLVALALVLAGSALGGLLGARWHRKADDVLVGTREGALTPYVADGAPGTGTASLAPTAAAPAAGAAPEPVATPTKAPRGGTSDGVDTPTQAMPGPAPSGRRAASRSTGTSKGSGRSGSGSGSGSGTSSDATTGQRTRKAPR
jgi:uncharacterized membrane protein YgcG